MPFHKDLTEIHVSHAFTFADAATRLAASVVSADVGKMVKQTDNDTYYIIKNTVPEYIGPLGATAADDPDQSYELNNLSLASNIPVNKNFIDGDVTVGSDQINEVAHGYVTGLKLQFTTTGTLPAGLSLITDYFIIKIDDDNYQVAISLANALTGTQVDITSAAGGGTHTADVDAALIIELVGKDGADPSVGNPVKVGFRNVTATNGTYVQRTVTNGLSVVISAGSTLGQADGVTHTLKTYLIDNAGTVELGVSQSLFDENTVQSSTAEGGAGAADANGIIYSMEAHTNKAIRLIGRITNSQATAGTWVSTPSELSLYADAIAKNESIAAIYTTNAGNAVVSSALIDFENKVKDTHNAVTIGASWVFTAPAAGLYQINATLLTELVAPTIGQELLLEIHKNNVRHWGYPRDTAEATDARRFSSGGGALVELVKGETIHFEVTENIPAVNYTPNVDFNRISIHRVGF